MIVWSAATSAAIIAAHAANQNSGTGLGSGNVILDSIYELLVIVILIKLFFDIIG